MFASLASSEVSELGMHGYLIALRSFSAETVSEAVFSVLDGSAWDKAFAPRPPELAKICRDKDFPRRQSLDRARREHSGQGFSEREPTPEERARIAAKCDALSAALARAASGDRLKYETAKGVQAALANIAARARA